MNATGVTDSRSCLVLSPRLPPAVGGGESFGELLIAALAAGRWRVSVFTSGPVDAEIDVVVRRSGGRIHLPNKTIDNRSTWERETFGRSEELHRILADEHSDAVFCLSHDSAVTAVLAVAHDLDPVPAVVGSYVDTSVLRSALGMTRARFVYSLQRVGAIIAESEFYRSVAVDCGFPRQQTVVASAVDIDRFSGADADRGRRLVSAEPGDRLILCASRFTPRKRIEDLLHAVAGLVDDHPRIRLVIAGSVQSGSDRYRASISALVHQLGLGPQCTIVEDLGRQDIADLTVASDIAVQPSEFEGLGRSLLEAMAAGKCVVATDTSGFDEIVTNEVTGLTCPVGDPTALRAAIERLLNAPVLAKSIGEKARQWVSENMSPDQLGRAAFEAYRIAADHRGRPLRKA